MKKIILVFIFLFLLTNAKMHAQTVNPISLAKSVDSLLTSQFKPNEPGISILIANKNGIIYKKAFGSANLELNVPMQPDMIFRIDSVYQ